jgi:hypothetical protein
MSGSLLAELPEDQATGAIAVIYDEIRRSSGVPYVSSLQRYLATMPGVLEWAWAAIRPAMVSGVVPETGWRLANDVRLTPFPPVSEVVRAAWKLDMGAYATIGAIAENFVRVSPVNLMTGACLRSLLIKSPPKGPGIDDIWSPPAMLPPMPGNVDSLTLPMEQQAVLMRFATEVDGAPFIPALYRQLARFPAFLAWLADTLVPRLNAPETNAARTAFRRAALEAAPAIVRRLPGLPPGPAPDAETTRRVLATIDRYAETSPEMTMFGRLILDAI